MKFKKRFLMYLAIVGVILAPSMAKAQDANPDHGWHRSVPTDGCNQACAAAARPTSRLQRNQTVYIPIVDVGGTVHIPDTTADTITGTCNPTGGTCTSAPLFISATTATICLDTQMGSTTAGDVDIKMYVCSDSTCAAVDSIPFQGVLDDDQCAEFGNTADIYNTVNVGHSWVYIEAEAALGSGETALVWITGH